MVDYLAEILHNLRNVDYGSAFEKYFKLSPSLSTRDKDGVRKTFSGLMKLIYPSGQATADDMEPLLRCAIEGRKRVKDRLCRIDSTMAAVDFSYTRAGSVEPVAVHVLEEDDYPGICIGAVGMMSVTRQREVRLLLLHSLMTLVSVLRRLITLLLTCLLEIPSVLLMTKLLPQLT